MIPCFNDGATVGEAVASVREQEPCELVVVNDGSEDDATLGRLEELQAEGVRVVHQVNRGLSAARMTGVDATSAQYVYPLDADDLLAPGAVTRLADALDAHPDAACAWGGTEVFGDYSHVARHPGRLDPWRVTVFNQLPYAGMFKRSALMEVGGWQLKGGYEDWDLWMALAERGYEGMGVPGVTTLYRVHGSRMWREAVGRHEEIFAVLRARHRELFAARRANWRRSDSGWLLKLALPAVDAIPVPFRTKRRLYLVLTNPRRALAVAIHRLRRSGT